jgi:hypothetical protein
MRILLTVLLLGLAGLLIYIRLSPSDTSVWHVAPDVQPAGDYPGEGRFLAVRAAVPADSLSRLAERALATPRTRILAGSAETGMITFITRSALWGFPDYTTASLSDGTLRVYGRLRFGRRDMGVNAARIRGWLSALGL